MAIIKKQIINDLKNDVNLNTKVKIIKKNKFQILQTKRFITQIMLLTQLIGQQIKYLRKNKMKYQITSIYDTK